MLGAKDVAFPRLNLASWYLYVAGSLLALLSIDPRFGRHRLDLLHALQHADGHRGHPDHAGRVHPRLQLDLHRPQLHRHDPQDAARGHGLVPLPLMLWALYATAIIQILATPVLGITLLLLIVERVFEIGIFDPGLGGDPVLFQHFFWFYSHPAVYIMILPAMGVISELVSVHSRKPHLRLRVHRLRSIAIALLSFLVWGHHMFERPVRARGHDLQPADLQRAIPSAVKVFNWLATMYKGSISLTTRRCSTSSPSCSCSAIGGLTGIFLGTLPRTCTCTTPTSSSRTSTT
jgi:cytochrome c oxidase subunit 1